MNKKFTKLMAALALLVFMTPSLAGWGQDIVVTLDNIGAGLESTANTTETTTDITATGTTDVYTLNYYQCKKQGNAMLMTKSKNPYISNHTAMPGNIKSVKVFINSGAAGATTYDCAFSTTECHSAVSGIGAVNITGGNSHTFSNLTGGVINVEGEYFCITLGNANNGQVLKLVITCENSSSTAVATTTTIDATGISNTDIKDGTAAGSLSASVTYGSPATSVPSASVSWSGNNDAVATINPSTGAVTLVSAGTVKFKASYAGVANQYQASYADYNMTVTDSRYVVSDLTFTAAYGQGPGVADDGVEWTVESDGTESNYDGTKGIHYGTGSAAVQYIRLSTSYITEPIAKVIVNASTANGVSATVGVTIGGSAFGGDAQTLTSSAADYTFASSTNAQGEIIVTVTKPSSATGALYVKSIKVAYLAPAVKAPNIDVPTEFVGSTTATITCETEGATIYYSYDNSTWTEYTAALTITETKTIYAKAVKGEDESAVVSKTTTKTKPTPTVTISATGISNTDINSSTSAGNLSATVTYDNTAISGATVTWSGDADCVATINETTGAVTLVGAGQVTFTATFAGNGDYLASTGTYVMTVTNSNTNAPGTENDPYTVEEAICAIAHNGNVSSVYATGIVKQIVTAYDSQHENVTFDIVDATNDEAYLRAYRCGGTDAANVAQGDVVVVSGDMVYYQNSIYEFSQGCQLVSLTHPAVPTITVTPASLTGFTYVVDNGPSTTKTVSVSGANLTANISLSLGDNSNYEMCLTSDGTYTNSLSLSPTTGTVDATTVYVRLKAGLAVGNSYSGTITLTSTEATNKTVSLSGSVTEPVVDYATLPFDWNDASTPTGVTKSNIGSYGSGLRLKFNNNNNDPEGSIVLKTGAAPGTISFTIKANPATNQTVSHGTFSIMTSSNGTDYTTLASYTEIGTVEQTLYFTNLNADTRYIKWHYNKTDGNVALGDIHVGEVTDQSTTWTAGTFTPQANHVYVVNSGATLILDGDYSETLTNAANLIIEDGGQLITNSSVAATVKKNIVGHNTFSKDNGGWNFIATPVAQGTTIAESSLVSGTYDLYYYDEATHYWRNYKTGEGNADPGFTYLDSNEDNDGKLLNGKGYLYANKATTELSFAGTLQPSNTAITIDNLSYTATIGGETNPLAGWNLVGNPFPCNATVSVPCYIISNGTIVAVAAESAVAAPCSGVMVKATPTGQSVTFTSTTNAASFATGSNLLNITITKETTNRGGVSAGSTALLDNAIVSFNEGSQLEKFYFGESLANIYIPQNGKKYAIAVSDNTQGEMPLNFKAAENGSYTITVIPEGVELSYLHLIDNMTGADVDMLVPEPAVPEATRRVEGPASYTFNASVTDYESRFRLVFSTSSIFEDENGETFAYYNGSEWVIDNPSTGSGQAILQVVDVMGRILSSEAIHGNANINVNAPAGVYVLRLVNGENVKTQKIVIR